MNIKKLHFLQGCYSVICRNSRERNNMFRYMARRQFATARAAKESV